VQRWDFLVGARRPKPRSPPSARWFSWTRRAARSYGCSGHTPHRHVVLTVVGLAAFTLGQKSASRRSTLSVSTRRERPAPCVCDSRTKARAPDPVGERKTYPRGGGNRAGSFSSTTRVTKTEDDHGGRRDRDGTSTLRRLLLINSDQDQSGDHIRHENGPPGRVSGVDRANVPTR